MKSLSFILFNDVIGKFGKRRKENDFRKWQASYLVSFRSKTAMVPPLGLGERREASFEYNYVLMMMGPSRFGVMELILVIKEGKENGELDGPFGLGLLSNGNLVVGEYINNRISIFDNQGNFIKVIAAEDLKDPGHLFIDSDDNILITDDENQRIAIYSSQSRNLVKSIKTMENPRGIAMDRDGRIIVARVDHKIAIY